MVQTPNLPDPARLLPEVIALAKAGGALIRAEFHRPGGPRGQDSHAPIDAEVETLLRRGLLALHPCGFLGEETAPATVARGDLWVVDPQDGTRDFLAGRRGSALSVALVRDGVPVLGVVFAPVAPDDAGDLIAWAAGTILTRNGRPVERAAPGAHPVVALNAEAADYARHNHEGLPGWRVRALPSPAWRLALAAVGEVDAAMSLTAGLADWDIAGGHALLIGAGHVLVDRSGRPVRHGRGGTDGCIGGPAHLVARLATSRLGRGVPEPRRPARPKARVPEAGLLSRGQGCLLGLLAGDALGSAVEFLTAAEIARRHPGGVTELRDGGTWDLIAGQPTDDGELALALARALAAAGGWDAGAVGQAYRRWLRSGPFDIGGTTRDGIAALSGRGRARGDSQSNGALMRVAPVALIAAGDPARAARLGAEDAALTHPHPVCVAASAAFAAALAEALVGGDPQAMAAAAEAHAGAGEGAEGVRACLRAARRAPPAEFHRQMGHVVIALQNAFHHLLLGTPLAEALTRTVGQGGDTDTNAAICGALLGAAQGREAIPRAWRNAVLTCRPVGAPGVTHPRPTEYWPDDALDLAEALLSL